jgi:hypothetical protein
MAAEEMELELIGDARIAFSAVTGRRALLSTGTGK